VAAVPIASQTKLKKKSGAEAGFLRVLRFPLPIFIPPISPQSPSSIIWGWYNRPVVAAVPKVPHPLIKEKNICHNFPSNIINGFRGKSQFSEEELEGTKRQQIS
jgi:hypothetical protein